MGGNIDHLPLPTCGATRAELLADGWTDRTIKAAMRASRLVRIGRGWYATPPTILEAKMSLVTRLNPSAVLSHRTAAWLHGLRKSPPDVLDVIVPRTITALLAEARELTHPRASALVTLLSWAPEGARSNVERRVARALERLGIIVVLDYAIGPYRFDLVHVGARLGIEFDSEKYHATVEAFRHDRARQNLAVRRGWGFLRYHDFDVAHRFDVVVAEIAATIRERMGGARVESDWDRLPCWELYDNLHWAHAESYAADLGLLRRE